MPCKCCDAIWCKKQLSRMAGGDNGGEVSPPAEDLQLVLVQYAANLGLLQTLPWAFLDELSLWNAIDKHKHGPERNRMRLCVESLWNDPGDMYLGRWTVPSVCRLPPPAATTTTTDVGDTPGLSNLERAVREALGRSSGPHRNILVNLGWRWHTEKDSGSDSDGEEESHGHATLLFLDLNAKTYSLWDPNGATTVKHYKKCPRRKNHKGGRKEEEEEERDVLTNHTLHDALEWMIRNRSDVLHSQYGFRHHRHRGEEPVRLQSAVSDFRRRHWSKFAIPGGMPRHTPSRVCVCGVPDARAP